MTENIGLENLAVLANEFYDKYKEEDRSGTLSGCAYYVGQLFCMDKVCGSIGLEMANKDGSIIVRPKGGDVAQYKIGDRGPAGGFVFYDKGSYSDGWRYLECAPADVRVVGGKPTVDSSVEGYWDADECYVFGYEKDSDNPEDFSEVGAGNDTCIVSGKVNTEILVKWLGDTALTGRRDFDELTANYAAKICYDLEYGGFHDWFLPSDSELKSMYLTLSGQRLGSFAPDYYWSSSLESFYRAWSLDFNEGLWADDELNSDWHVRPVRAF